MGKIIIIILALFLLFGAFRDEIIEGIDNWRSDPTTENFLVATGPGDTSANVVLSYDLYQAALAEVSSVTSSNISDTPVATTYVEITKVLTIGGLVAGISRTMAIGYTAESQDTAMRTVGPFLTFLILGGCIFFIFWVGKRKGRG